MNAKSEFINDSPIAFIIKQSGRKLVLQVGTYAGIRFRLDPRLPKFLLKPV